MKWEFLSFFAFICIFIADCGIPESSPSENDIVVAEVGNRQLFNSELNNLIHPTVSSYDSTALANAYIDQWIRDQLLMREASRFFTSDFEIEKLVNDYREKLIKINMEEKIIEERYDTIVTRTELEEFYDEYREQFLLVHPVYRCLFTKILSSSDGINRFNRDWGEGNMEAVQSYLGQFGEEVRLDEETWYTWEEIEEWSDGFSQARARNAAVQRVSQDNYEYFLKVLEFRDEKEISPLSYVEYRLELMILQKRKHEIIEEYKKELYEKALESNLIKI